MPKNLSVADKSRITKAYREIGRVLKGGGAVVRSRSKKRVGLANKIAGMRTKGLRVAFVRNTPAGSKIRLDDKGQAIELIGKIKRLTIKATFLPDPEMAEMESKRITGLSKGATAYAVKYEAGGEGQTFSKELLASRLFVDPDTDLYNKSAAPCAIVAYWFPKSDPRKVLEIKERQKQRRKKAKKRWH